MTKSEDELNDGKNVNIKSWHRFSDFIKLLNMIRKLNPGIVIDELPDSNIFKLENELINDRRIQLEKWINNICSHEVLRNDELIQLFLCHDNDDDEFNIIKHEK